MAQNNAPTFPVPAPVYQSKWGAFGTGNGQFNGPVGLAVDRSGNVYVADTGNDRVQKFSSAGAYITQWGSSGTGDGQFQGPVRIAIDSADNVYVLDATRDNVQKFDSSGNFILKWGSNGSGDGQFQSGDGIAIGFSGMSMNELVFVADSTRDDVQVFDTDGVYQTEFGSSGSGNGQFDIPGQIAVDRDGFIYVTDQGRDDVQKFNTSFAYVTKWGTTGSGNGQFTGNRAIAVDDASRVYVADFARDDVQIFDSSGTYLTKFGGLGTANGFFRRVQGIAVGPSGNIYVQDNRDNRVQIFPQSTAPYVTMDEDATPTAFSKTLDANDIDGDTLTWSISSAASNGTATVSGTGTSKAITYAPDADFNGNDSFDVTVTDDGVGNLTATITVFVTVLPQNDTPSITGSTPASSATPSYWFQWGSAGSGDGQFSESRKLALDSSGNVYVADTGNDRIQKFDSSGVYLSQFGSTGSGDGNFSGPRSVVLDTSDNIYVVDTGNDRIQKFDSSGVYVSQWGSSGTGDGQFNLAEDIAIDTSGNLFVVDSARDVVQKFDSTGTFILKWGSTGTSNTQFQTPVGIAVDSSNDVYVADRDRDLVKKYDSSGNYILRWGSGFSKLSDVADDADGNIFIVDWDRDYAKKFTNIGGLLFTWGSAGTGDGEFTTTRGIVVNDSGTIYVSDYSANRIQAFTGGGAVAVAMDEDGTPTAFSLSMTASDPDGDTLSWSISSAASNGTASATGTGTSKAISYTPTANYSGSDTFIVQISDGLGGMDTRLVNVAIAAQADDPVITEGATEAVTMDEDGSPTAFSLTLNATDGDGDTLTWSISSAASDGTATASGTGTSKAISYTPTANFSGSDSFDVQVSDGTGRTDTITVNVTVDPVGDDPVITEGATTAVMIDEDGTPTAFSLTLNATDADGDTLTWTISSTANFGTATTSGTGVSKAISYTSLEDFSGSDSFNVQVSDGTGGIDTITVNVTVDSQNDAPVISEQPDWSDMITANDYATTDGSADHDLSQVIATDGVRNFVLVWRSKENLAGTGTDFDIFVSRSTDNGVNWTAAAPLNSNATTDGAGNDSDPSLTTDGLGNWITVWWSATDLGGIETDRDLFVSRSTDNGATWSAVAVLNSGATDAGGDHDSAPVIATDGNGTWITAWESKEAPLGTEGTDYDVFYSKSTDNGVTWSTSATLNSNAIGTFAHDKNIRLATDTSGKWVAVWDSKATTGGVGSDEDIFVSTSADNGATWSAAAALNSNAGTDGKLDQYPIVTTNTAGNWVVAWYSETNLGGAGADGDIFVSTSTDNGATWSVAGLLNSNAGSDTGDDQVGDIKYNSQGNLWATWQSFDETGGLGTDQDILYSYSSDDGATWSASAPLNSNASTDTGSDSEPSLVTDSVGRAVVVWQSDDTIGNTVDIDSDVFVSTYDSFVDMSGPVAVTMDEDATPTAFDLTLYAADEEHNTLTWSISSAASNGTASASGTGTSKAISYTPDADFSGNDSFVVTVTDDGAGSLTDTITVNVTVDPVNDVPVITEGATEPVTMDEDGAPTAFGLTLNATDADGDTLTWSISSAASNGTATASGTGASKAIGYTPAVNFNGSDSFVITVTDNGVGNLTDSITVNVTVDPQNDAPVVTQGTSVSVTMDEDATPTAFALTLNATDVEGDALTWSVSSAASNGTASASGTGTSKTIGYTPTANFNGSDSFVITVTDNGVGNLTDSITVNVTVDPQNDAPVITEGTSVSVTMDEDATPTAFGLTLNATDADNDALTWSISSAASNGSALTSGTGTSKAIGYTPNADYNGSDSFVVTVTDNGTGNLSDTITVNVTVDAIDDGAPVITQGTGPLSVTMDEDGAPTAWSAPTLGATDPDADDTLTWSLASAASNGTATVSGTGGTPSTFDYVPTADYNGNDSFVVRVVDNNAGTDTITVNVTVDPVDDGPPVISQGGGPLVVTMDEDGTPTPWSAPSLDAIDPDSNDTLTWSVSGAASNGTATVSGTGASPSTFDYVPTAEYSGTDSFEVSVDDGNGGIDTIDVDVTIDPQSDAPAITEGDSISVTMDEDSSPTVFNLTLNATDDDNDTITWSISSAASNGQASVSGTPTGLSQVITYDPILNFNGSDSFSVMADDGTGQSATIAVNVTVSSREDVPEIAEGDSVVVVMDEDESPTPFALTLNASDGDGDTLTWSISNPAANGSASVSNSPTGTSQPISYSPDTNFSGSEVFEVQVDDGNGNMDTITVNVTVTPVDDAPVIDQTGPISIVMDEDGFPAAWMPPILTATSLDVGILTWSLLVAPSNGTAIVEGTGASPTTLDYLPDSNFNGSDSFVVAITESNSAKQVSNVASITIDVTINSINDAPILDFIGALQVDENQTLSIQLTGSDLENDTLTFAAANTPTGSVFDVVSHTFSWTPDFGASGVYDVQFIVTDDGSPPLSHSESITIAVGDVNQPPELNPIGAQTVDEGERLSFTVSAFDPDGLVLTFGISDLPGGATFDALTGDFDWTPSFEQSGVYDLLVTVSDDGTPTEAHSEAITITVGDVNRPPVLDFIGNRETGENEALNFVVTGTDPDGGTLTFSATNLPTGATFDAFTQTFNWTPGFGSSGIYDVQFTVTDDGIPTETDAEIIGITVGDVNRPPVLDPVGNRQAEENVTLNFYVTASDADGDALNYSAANLPRGATLNSATGEFSWTPSFGASGVFEIQFIVTDNGSPAATDSETISVTVGDVNRPPTLDTIGDQQVDEGETLTFVTTASDPDGDPVTISTGVLPAGATFNPNSNTFSWTPSFGSSGTYDVQFTVTDAGTPSETHTETIEITVGNVNRPPVLDSIGNRQAEENVTLSFAVTATDADGDTLTFSAANLPRGATLDTMTGAFSWMPSFGSSGVFDVQFIVTDNATPAGTDTETITISVGDINRPPRLDAIGDRQIAEGETLTFRVTASDPDGDSLSITTGILPSGASFDEIEATFTWTPNFGASGIFEIQFIVTDDRFPTETDSETITIAVGDVNLPPVLDPIGDRQIEENLSLDFVISASDSDGDSLTFSATNIPAGASLDGVTGAFNWTPEFGSSGLYEVQFIVADNGSPVETDDETIVISVGDVNRPPSLDSVGDREVIEGETIEFVLTARDPDGDMLIFSATNLPDFATFDTQTRTFTWTPGNNTGGTEAFVDFTVTDSGLPARSESETVLITVLHGDPPIDEMHPFIITGPVADSITPTSVVISWTTDLDTIGSVYFGVTGEMLDRKVDDTVESFLHTVQLDDLTPDTRYDVQVTSRNSGSMNEVASHVISFSTRREANSGAPTIVSGPVVLDVTDTEAILGWTTDRLAYGDLIFSNGSSTQSGIEIVASIEHVVRVDSLSPSTTYTVVVRSTDLFGNMSETDLSVTTPATLQNPPPIITEGPVVEVNSYDIVVLRWRTDQPATSEVEYGVNSVERFIQDVPGLRNEHHVPVVGLTPGTEYSFRIRSLSWLGAGPVIGEELFVTTTEEPDTSPPVFTVAPFVITTDTTATIIWETDEPGDTVVEYGQTTSYAERRSDPAKTLLHRIALVGLVPGQTYFYTCSSTDSATPGNQSHFGATLPSTQGETLSFMTDAEADLTSPMLESGPSVVSVTDTTATILWTTDERSDSFVTYQSNLTNEVETQQNDDFTRDHLVTLTQLQADTTYSFNVSSADVDGNLFTSSVMTTFTTTRFPDTAPPEFLLDPLEIFVTETTIVVQWATDEFASGELIFGPQGSTIDNVIPTSRLQLGQTLTLTNLEPGTTYVLFVRSVDQSQNVAVSGQLSATTLSAETGHRKKPLGIVAVGAFGALALSNGGGGSGGDPCFIATAAYGTPFAADIDVLRQVRDTYMLDNALGTAFVDFYYQLSPAIADIIARNPIIATFVRMQLAGIVTLLKLLMAAPFAVLALSTITAGLTLLRLRRRQKSNLQL